MQAPPADRFLLQNHDPKQKAVIAHQLILDFRELTEKVLSAASALLDEGISKNDRVGIYSPNSPEYMIIILALWQIGAIPAPLNIRLSKNELSDQIKILKCRHLIIGPSIELNYKYTSFKAINYALLEGNETSIIQKTKIDLNKTAVIIFTSGSGKSQKGVRLSFNSFYQNGFNSNKLLRYSYSDRWLLSLPLYHIGGFAIFTRAILWGIPVIIPKSVSAVDLAAELKISRPTFISLVASQLKSLIDKNVSPNTELKNCLLGGGFSDYFLVKKAIESGYPVNIVYGSTETASFVTALLTDEFDAKRNSAGRAVPPCKIYIYDQEANELKPYEVGEVAIQTTALMEGYINVKEENIKNGIYHTGDIGYLDDEGYLFLVGRKEYMISTGGENVNPQEVESALLEHPGIDEAVVFPLKDQKWGEIVAVAVVLKEGYKEINDKELKKFLGEKLTKFKIPKKVFYEEELPKTDLGKVKRSELIKNYIL